jgi:hypothetical protein
MAFDMKASVLPANDSADGLAYPNSAKDAIAEPAVVAETA